MKIKKKLTEKEEDRLIIIIMIFGFVLTMILPIIFGSNRLSSKNYDSMYIDEIRYRYYKSINEENDNESLKSYINKKPIFNKKSSSKNKIKVIATVYNPTKGQCDNSPLITADNSEINLKKLKNRKIKWIAVSRDLLERGLLSYGDKVRIKSNDPKINGTYEVHDTMHKRWRNRVDLLMHEENSTTGKWEVDLELITRD